MVTLHGDGFDLRPLALGDALALKAGGDDAQIAAFEFPGPSPLANVVAAIERWNASWALDGPERNFGIWDAKSGDLCGNVEVRVLRAGWVNLSYLIFPMYRRRGLAVAASRLVLEYAESALAASHVEVKVLDWNAASLAVAESLGLRRVRSEPTNRLGTFIVSEGRLNSSPVG